MLPRIGLVSFALLLSLGCGGPGSFNGEVAGNKLSVNDAAFVSVPNATGGIGGVLLMMADVPDICADARANRFRKNSTYVWMQAYRTQGTYPNEVYLSPDKGIYTVVADFAPPPSNFAYASFIRTDANCFNVIDTARAYGKSGTVDLEAIQFKTDGALTGKFDITFGTQNDSAKGTFNASFCDAAYTDAASCE